MRVWRGGYILGMVAGLLAVVPAHAAAPADPDCDRRGPCTYEGTSFRLTVKDAATGKPLADVHALAEWVLEGPHGRNGPLMVQDSVSGRDGEILFAAWGPLRGPASGLVAQFDPAITLFKSGHKTLFLYNEYYVPGRSPTTRLRQFDPGRHKIALERFRGTPEAWVEELRKAAYPDSVGGLNEEQFYQFRTLYLNRLRRVWAQREKVPWQRRDLEGFFWSVQRDLRRFEEGRR